MTEYAKRDARALEPYYNRHVGAMTREKLNAKSDIAAELAWRDKLIAELTAKAGWLNSQIDDARDPLSPSMVDDLCMIVSTLAYAMQRASPNDRRADGAMNYLKRIGWKPSLLREAVRVRVFAADTQLLNWLEKQEGIQVAQRRPPLDDAYYWIAEFPERDREDGERGLNLRGTLAAAMKRWPAPDRVEPKP